MGVNNFNEYLFSRARTIEWTYQLYWVWYARISPWVSSTTAGIFPIPWTPLHYWWCYRIIMPPSLREEVFSALHAVHQGVTFMIYRAESSVFWPGITPAITALRARCNHCNRIASSNPSAPPTPLMSPHYPFQCVCSDFFNTRGLLVVTSS